MSRSPSRCRTPLAVACLVAVASVAWAQDDRPLGRDLARAVDAALARRFIEPGWVAVTVEGRRATLRGGVPDELHRALVVLIAENVPGVDRVKDELRVDPALPRWRPTPHEKRQDLLANVRAALRTDPELRLYTTLRANVENRALVVRGEVATLDHKVAADLRVLSLPGVLHFDNRIVVRPDASRRAPPSPPRGDDAELERELFEALRSDPLLRPVANVDAHVWGGRVLLQGTADDRVARAYSVELARRAVRQHEQRRERAAQGPLERLLERGKLARELEPPRDALVADVLSNVLIVPREPARGAPGE